MKTQLARLLIITLVIVLVIPLSPLPLRAIPAMQIPTDSPPSNQPPKGYKPTTELHFRAEAASGGSDILLVQTALPWASDANTQVLGALGYAYDIVDMSNIAQVDLFRYPVILIVNDQVQAFYDQYANQIAAFENYVASGGTLVFFASSDGWAQGTLRANLPGGVVITTPWYENNNYIANPTHPIVSAELSDGNALVDADLYSDYCSHGYFSALPDNANIILRESHGYPTLVEYEMGQGRVIASTLTWEHNWAYRNAFGHKALDDVFLYAFSSSGVVDGIINVFPNAVPADGTTPMNVTLAGATPGHRVRLISSRGSVDTFENATGVTNNLGRFVTTLRSSTPSVAVLTAQDLNTGQTFPASTSVNFTTVGGGVEPPVQEPIVITSVKAEHPLDARYLEGVPVKNQINVIVDWKGSSPGRVDFTLNDSTHSTSANNNGASYMFDMGNDLRRGANALRITAYNASGQISKTESFVFWSIPMPVWMFGIQRMGFAALPILASGDVQGQLAYKMGFHLPPYNFEIDAPGFGVPDGETKLGVDFKGNLAIPLYCAGSYEASLSIGGEKGFKFLNAKLEGRLTGALEAKPIGLCMWELPKGNVKFEVEASKNLYRKPVLVMIAYFNAAVGVIIEQTIVFLHVEELVSKVLGEFYIDGKAHVTLGSDIYLMEESPYFQFRDLSVGGGLGIEGGYRYNLPIFELKVYAGADGSVEFVRQGPVPWPPPFHEATFDRIVLTGEVGAEVRSGWFEKSTRGEISWEYPATLQLVGATITNLDTNNWHLTPHSSHQEIITFHNESGAINAFTVNKNALLAVRPLASQSTITSVLVSNVYTYTEPTLAHNSTNNHALLLWTHDDINKPVGQAHEIAFSRWDGTTWSTPAGVTNDNRLDSAPQVAWTNDGKAIAIWQRLNDVLPPTATLDVTTTRKIEIATATYDPVANDWSPVALLTDNNALEMTPALARNNSGNLLAVWRQNSAGFLGGNATNPDRIIAAFHNADWGTPQTAVDGIPGLVDLAAGFGNNHAVIAYTQYLAVAGSITPTLQLFTSAWDGGNWSAPVQQTNDALGHRTPQVIYTTVNEPVVVWLAGGELRMQNLVSGVTARLSLPPAIGNIDEFRVIQDTVGNIAAVFTAQSAQRDLFVAFYDQTHQLWGLPIPLTHDRTNEGYPAPAFDTNGRLLLAYAATAVTSVARSVTTRRGESINFTIPTEGQTDLVTLAHDFVRNVTLREQNFTVSNDYPVAGESVTLAATVTNTGDLALDNVSVAFYDGDPALGGALIGSSNLAAPLAAGFPATLTAAYNVPATGGIRQIYAVVDANNQIDEVNETDNRVQLAVFGPDLALTSVGVRYWGGNAVDLISHIRNLGTTTSPTTTITFDQGAGGGTLALTDTVPAVTAGGQITLTTPWIHPDLAPGSHLLLASVNPVEMANFTEAHRENNAFTTTIQAGPDLMVSPYALQTTPLTATTAAFTVTLANIGNVPADPVPVNLYRRGDLTDRYLLASVQAPLLAPGQTTVLTGEVAGPLGCGLYVFVNPERVVQEISHVNNLVYGAALGGQCASFYNTPGTAIAPATVIFTDTSTGDNSSWLWAFGDGNTSTEQHPIHQFTQHGFYTVTLTVNSASDSDSYSLPNAVRIYQQAHADFTASPVLGKTPLQVTFSDLSFGDIQSWFWDLGDGNLSVEQNPIHNYTSAGIYTVTLTVSGYGGTSTAVRRELIAVTPTPATILMQTNPSTIIADGISTATVEVTVQASNGKPLSGEEVHFATTLGTITGPVVTNINGVATAVLTSATNVGNAVITATVGNVKQTAQVQYVAGPPASIVQSNRLAVVADGISTVNVAVIVRDANSNLIQNQTVEFSATMGAITAAATTNNQGVATATFTAPATPGTAIVTAKAGNIMQIFEITLVGSQEEIFLPLITR